MYAKVFINHFPPRMGQHGGRPWLGFTPGDRGEAPAPADAPAGAHSGLGGVQGKHQHGRDGHSGQHALCWRRGQGYL